MIAEGHLAGSVSKTHNTCSLGFEFTPHVGCRVYLRKKKKIMWRGPGRIYYQVLKSIIWQLQLKQCSTDTERNQ